MGSPKNEPVAWITPATASNRYVCKSRVAFSEADIADAKRCAPPGDLLGYAAQRGLADGGRTFVPHLLGIMPRFSEYLFNVCLGELAPGRFGAVWHELFQVPATSGSENSGPRVTLPGDLYAARVRNRQRWWGFFVPYVDVGFRDDEPFGMLAAWAPSTALGFAVPEAAHLPAFSVRSAHRSSPALPLLEDCGVAVPGYRLTHRGDASDADLRRWLEPVAAELADLLVDFVDVEHLHGQLRIRVGGYVMDPQRLDRLVAAGDRIAASLVAAGPVAAQPVPFVTPLPSPEQEEEQWRVALDALAGQIGIEREDPATFHFQHPDLPAPGRSAFLGRFTLADGSAARFSCQVQKVGGREFRSAVVLPRPDGIAGLPAGGLFHAPTRMFAATSETLLVLWNLDVAEQTAAFADTVARAEQTRAALGLDRPGPGWSAEPAKAVPTPPPVVRPVVQPRPETGAWRIFRPLVRLLGLVFFLVGVASLVLLVNPGPTEVAEWMGRACGDRFEAARQCGSLDATNFLLAGTPVFIIAGGTVALALRPADAPPRSLDLRWIRRSLGFGRR